jgi:hypothetical protein
MAHTLKIQLSEKDIAQSSRKASNAAHRFLMEQSGIKSDAHKNKKAYSRKEKHRKFYS